MEMRALIIGGGIGGLCTALALRKAGLEVAVYERGSEIREVGAGLSLWPNAVKALGKLGVGKAILAQSIPNVGGGIRDQHGRLITAESNERIEQLFGAPTIIVHRAELLALLENAVGAGTLHLNYQLSGFEQDSSGVTARFTDGETARGDLLIGADGIHSAVRGQLFPDVHPRYAGYTVWRAITHFAYLPTASYWGESWGRGARFGLVPVSAGRVYWFAVLNAPENAPVPQNDHQRYLLKVFQGWHHPIPRLLDLTHNAAILHNDIYDISPLKSWTRGRVTLLGDAAHAMTPNLGQGACQAIEDAVVLGAQLQAATDVPIALKAYEAARINRTRSLQIQSWRIGQIGQLENPLACWLRDTVFRMMPRRMREQQLRDIIGYEV
jgi:2-polyprenyl-6-methoxyphenol hydroxylase-like FAD-dependent oxidoreductase